MVDDKLQSDVIKLVHLQDEVKHLQDDTAQICGLKNKIPSTQ